MVISTIGCSICAQTADTSDLETTPHTKEKEQVISVPYLNSIITPLRIQFNNSQSYQTDFAAEFISYSCSKTSR